MRYDILLFEALAFAVLFTGMVFLPVKDLEAPSNIHNYPPDIQEEYFKTHKRVDVSYRSKKVLLKKGIGILLFTVILAVCARLAGAHTFREGFFVGLLLMVFIGCYDTFFIDWVLFANLKCFRLPGTEHMDRAYHQKWFHLKGILWPGILFALIVGVLTGIGCLV
ncbi:MAG: hypothetical protein IKE21_10125 [Erysipelotrichaceae bacterium]|nr:hypothetical protein [Erysipelotrichaceae bacterium]